LKEDKGVTLIELLIALVISAIIVAGLYRTFVYQQKSYAVQEQVADMQQNVRVAINRMMREIRMAGFGGVDQVLGLVNGVNGFTQAITPGADTITIVGGFKQIRRDNGDPITVDSVSGNTVTLDYTPDAEEFKTPAKRFISIGGVESHKFEIDGKVLTLNSTLRVKHLKGTPIFKVQAITYQVLKEIKDGKDTFTLKRNENTGGGFQPLAENIESLQFEYFDASGNPTVTPADVRMVQVTLTARTDLEDRELKKVWTDGFRRRVISSNIQIRNMGISP
jgi:prepilin-type N-terminal cleavage/methylation domain-containing protein